MEAAIFLSLAALAAVVAGYVGGRIFRRTSAAVHEWRVEIHRVVDADAVGVYIERRGEQRMIGKPIPTDGSLDSLAEVRVRREQAQSLADELNAPWLRS